MMSETLSSPAAHPVLPLLASEKTQAAVAKTSTCAKVLFLSSDNGRAELAALSDAIVRTASVSRVWLATWTLGCRPR